VLLHLCQSFPQHL